MLLEAIRSIPDTVPADDRTLGWSVLEWCSRWLEQPDGENAGSPWRFTGEQARIVLRWYEIDDAGRFVHRRGVLRRMKGHGKDPFLAALCACEFVGRCRFDRWGDDGLPLAAPHPLAWVQICATTISQTRNTMLLLPGMFSAEAIDEYGIDLGKEIVYSAAGGQIQAVTSSPRALEGNRATFIVANESHLWLEANQGLAMAEVIKRNLAKARDGAGRVMEITNAHQVAEGSAAEATFDAWRAGTLTDLYYDSVEAPDVDLTDRDAVTAALTAARGDSTWLNVQRIADEIADPTTPTHVAQRYYLNRVVAVASDSWMPMGLWDACALPDYRIPEGAECVLAFDGSFSMDATALVAVEIGDVPHIEVAGLWENPNPADREFRIPIEDVEDAIRATCKRLKVRELTADPYRWMRSLELLERERVAKAVSEFPQRPARMIPATTRLFEAVCNAAVTHSGDPDLRRHVSNAVLKVSSAGGMVYKDSKSSPRKIDLCVAAIMGFDRACAMPPAPRVQFYVSRPDGSQVDVLAEAREQREQTEREPQPRGTVFA